MSGFDNSGQDALPASWKEIQRATRQLGFDMPSEPRTAVLLRALAASKPGGRLLEIGTGTGLATAALLAGMDHVARLVSVDIDPVAQQIAQTYLGFDQRVRFVLGDGLEFLRTQSPQSFDLVFADAMPGKYDDLPAALTLVRPGGFYIGDDMLPQQNWPPGHQERVDALSDKLSALSGWTLLNLAWGSGFVIAVRLA